MSILRKGYEFQNLEAVTTGKLHALVESSSFTSGAVDGVTMQLTGSGAMAVKTISAGNIAANAVTADKIADDAVETDAIKNAAVTAEKIAPSASTLFVPAGAVLPFAMETAPTGWLKCDGAAVSRTTYAGLWAAIGTKFGAGDGSTTFNVPDLRGEFIRGWDNGRGVDATRVLGSAQKATNVITGTSTGSVRSLCLQNKTASTLASVLGGEASTVDGAQVGSRSNDSAVESVATAPSITMSVRPRNIAMLYCIKA